MYNRYLRNDQGVYTCVPQEEPREASPRVSDTPRERPQTAQSAAPREEARETTFQQKPPENDRAKGDGTARDEGFALLGRLLDRLHLQDLDGADLMLLALLFFLFEEKADDELLIALGLLLIL